MSIPASHIVEVIPRVIGAGGTSLQINGLLLTDNVNVPAGHVLEFTSAADIQDYMGTAAVEAQNASYYFAGFDNSLKKPSRLYVTRHCSGAVAAWTRGASITAKLADFQAISADSLTITIDGTVKTLANIDLSEVTSFSDVAEELTTAFNSSATVTFTSLFNAFVVTSATTGAESEVSFASDSPLAALMKLREADGAVQSLGMAAQTIADTLGRAVLITANWVTFTTTWEASDDEILACREWSKSKGVRFWAVNWVTKKPAYLDKTSSGHVAATLKDEDMGYGNLVIDSLKYALFEMGAAASVNYAAKTPAQGKIVYMFKAQSGLAFNVSTQADAEALQYWGISFYGDWATANDNFKFFATGNTWGQYKFVDTAIDAIWLNNEIQIVLMTLLTVALAIPYNEEGYTRIKATLQGQDGPVFHAVQNGVIRRGVVLNQTQRDQVNLEAGLDIASTIENEGYYISVKDPGASVRQNRGTPDINLWYTDGGGVQKIEMASTVVL